MERFFPKFVRDITHSQSGEGAIADTVPFYTGGQPADVVCVSYLMFGLEGYKQYGDINIVKDEYANFKAWVDYLLTRQKDYIMDYYYYGDWVTPTVFKDSITDGIYVSSVYLYWHLISMARLALIAGNSEDNIKYSEMAKQSKKAVNEKYYNKATNNYANCTQTANSLALSLNLAPEGDRKFIAANIAKNMIDKNYHCTCGNQGYRHMFYALSDEGYIDDLIKMITNPEYPGWGYMIACGATTVWERWEKEMQNEMHSFDHPMFGSYDAWFYRYMGGIQIQDDAKACDKVRIKPYIPSEISYVKCSVDTLRGKIVSNWTKTDSGIRYEISIPSNTNAEIELGKSIISINGNEMKPLDNTLKLCSGNYIIITQK